MSGFWALLMYMWGEILTSLVTPEDLQIFGGKSWRVPILRNPLKESQVAGYLHLPSPTTNSSHLNMEVWNDSFLLGRPFASAIVSFGECNYPILKANLLLKNSWETTFFPCGCWPIFRCKLLVLGRVFWHLQHEILWGGEGYWYHRNLFSQWHGFCINHLTTHVVQQSRSGKTTGLRSLNGTHFGVRPSDPELMFDQFSANKNGNQNDNFQKWWRCQPAIL